MAGILMMPMFIGPVHMMQETLDTLTHIHAIIRIIMMIVNVMTCHILLSIHVAEAGAEVGIVTTVLLIHQSVHAAEAGAEVGIVTMITIGGVVVAVGVMTEHVIQNMRQKLVLELIVAHTSQHQ